MKMTHIKNGTDRRSLISLSTSRRNEQGVIRDRIQAAKEEILLRHQPLAKGQERLLALVLNEAEALAWQTEYPQLIFPTLGIEKTEAAMSWQQRQESIRQNGELAFAA
jgi:hypothetical protein